MVWLGFLAIGFTMFILSDITRIFMHTPALRYQVTITTIVVTILVGVYSLLNVARGPHIKELSIHSTRLTTSTPITLVQLTDLHLNLMTSPGWLKNVVTTTNNLQPDIIVITGDLIESDLTKRQDLCALLRQLRAKHGIYAISGNHEDYAGLQVFEQVAREAGIAIIDNQTVATGAGIELIGISDRPANPPYLTTIVPSSSTFSVLLSHRPDVFDRARTKGISLQLSGHTHAGQIPPMDAIVYCAFKYPKGLYEKDGATLYTNPGTGWWGPPMRLFSHCEILKIVLEKAN
ncbi:MAG: metallophosphoesterase [Endomicrobiales bacterium]